LTLFVVVKTKVSPRFSGAADARDLRRAASASD
jgi:hypothetical protein